MSQLSVITAFTVASIALGATLAHADNTNSVTFSDNALVNASVLGSTIAASNVNFAPLPESNYAGNIVGKSAFSGASGIIAVNQNSGANASVQQAVTFKANDITLTPTH